MKTCFIPKKLHIGFQKRNDTFTGKLAYIIYEDEKGVLRKEKSWNSWRDESIETIVIDNVPTPNFVFNKGVHRDNYYFGSGRHVFRIYDPRDFEFEITVDNVIGILMHSDVCKRDIVEQCVYAWAGTDLVLLPVNSKEYQESVKFTAKQSEKVSAKSLVKGMVYERKKHAGQWMYIGYYPYMELEKWTQFTQHNKGKRHVFMNLKTSEFEVFEVGSLSTCVSSEPCADYAEQLIRYENSHHSKMGVKLVGNMIPLKESEQYHKKWFKMIDNTSFINFEIRASDYYNPDFKGKIRADFHIYLSKLIQNEDGIKIVGRTDIPDDYAVNLIPELVQYLKQHNIDIIRYRHNSYWGLSRHDISRDILVLNCLARSPHITYELDYIDFYNFLTTNGYITSVNVLSADGDILKTIP